MLFAFHFLHSFLSGPPPQFLSFPITHWVEVRKELATIILFRMQILQHPLIPAGVNIFPNNLHYAQTSKIPLLLFPGLLLFLIQEGHLGIINAPNNLDHRALH